MIGKYLNIKEYCEHFISLIQWKIPHKEINLFLDILKEKYRQQRKIFIIGNGGSSSNSSHFCEDLSFCTINKKKDWPPRLKVISLTDNTPTILAIANDCGYEQIFRQQLMNLAEVNDLLIAISGSGNSANILSAVNWADQHGLYIIGCTGFDGGKLAKLCDLNIHIDYHDMGMVETVHLLIFHWLVDKMYMELNK